MCIVPKHDQKHRAVRLFSRRSIECDSQARMANRQALSYSHTDGHIAAIAAVSLCSRSVSAIARSLKDKWRRKNPTCLDNGGCAKGPRSVVQPIRATHSLPSLHASVFTPDGESILNMLPPGEIELFCSRQHSSARTSADLTAPRLDCVVIIVRGSRYSCERECLFLTTRRQKPLFSSVAAKGQEKAKKPPFPNVAIFRFFRTISMNPWEPRKTLLREWGPRGRTQTQICTLPGHSYLGIPVHSSAIGRWGTRRQGDGVALLS